MAVPFHVPDAPSTSAVSSTTSSTTMTAPQPQNPTTTTTAAAMSPVNSEYLVQAFCEALYRYSRAGGSLTAPPSPSPSCAPYGMFTFDSHLDDLSMPSPRRFRSHSLSAPLPRQLSRQHLPSQGHDMTDDDDDNPEENFNEEANYMEEHYHNYMVARERLQEFSGRVPQQRKKKATDSENNPQQQYREVSKDEEEKVKNKPKEKFAWPLVALGVLALGCGLLATTR